MSALTTVSIIWYKKDLRISDHQPLVSACKSGSPVIALYVWEPTVMCHPDYSHFHQYWIQESLKDLNRQLSKLNISLVMIHGDILTAIGLISQYYNISHIYAHEETGNMVTYDRDLQVIHYCGSHGISFVETPNNGVVRRLKSRDTWDAHWKRRMQKPIIAAPQAIDKWQINHELSSKARDTMNSFVSVVKPPGWQYQRELPGEQAGQVRLRTFIHQLSSKYLYIVSKPQEAMSDSSRLSAYITYGNLSIKQVYQAYQIKSGEIQVTIKQSSDLQQIKYMRNHIRSLRAFSSRLHWHCHFIQKLESRPKIELVNQNTEFDHIRQEIRQDYITNWEQGITGIPLVDAGMRCLAQLGWINFRMRAMLTSFICNTCMQPWQVVARYLARVFVDYEPGIHYSQFQMQSGTTGINTIRIYNPLKQMKDKDEDLKFIRSWLPELHDLSNEQIGLLGTSAGNQMLTMLCHVYPRAMIDISSANRRSRDILRAVMKDQRTKAQARAVYQKVGSRSFNSRRRKKSTSKLKSSRSIQSAQASLFDNIDLSA